MNEVSNPRLKNILESLLFVANRPLTPEEMAAIIGVEPELVSLALQELLVEYEGKGIRIAKIAGGWQMVTISENSNYVEALLSSPIVTTLSGAALETLAVISYKQPVTKLEIENIRGVNSDGVINTLLEKRMIKEVGRGDGLGRPILYGTSNEFLRHFGLKDLGDLPALPEGVAEQTRAFREGTILPPEKEEI
jgi:segregation and condensation protein B